MITTPEANDAIIDGKFKDSSPAATIERIKGILREINIQAEMTWFESGVPYCYSNKLKIPGTSFRAIGKGLTKEFAIASAYGELIERLQLGIIYGPTSLKDGDYAIEDSRFEMLPARQLLENHRDWYQKMSDLVLDSTGEKITPEQMLAQCSTREGMISVTPYLELSSLEKVYFPTVLRKRIYGSNGCAAGNTPEEALVQAISEIVERGHQLRILKDGLSIPEIPEEDLKKYEISYKIIDFVRRNGYKVIIKDASLNTGFPVICACIIDRRTGRYHTHFGAHPVFEIALERSLTESFQGRSITAIAENEAFSPKSSVKFNLNDFYIELRRSSGNKLPGFFVDDSPFTYDPDMGTDSCDNKEILRFCMDYFTRQGYSLLVRDCSCLGFPTYQVIVPGYSECYINRISSKSNDQRYAPYALSTLRDPVKATAVERMGLLMHLDKIRDMDAVYTDLHGFAMMAKIPSITPRAKQNYLMAAALGYVYHSIGRYREAASFVGKMIPKAPDKDLEYLICLKRFYELMADSYGMDYATRVITCFHQPETVDELLNILRTKANPLERFVMRCDKQCAETCPLHGVCYLKKVDSIADMLDSKMAELDFNQMANYLRNIL